MLGESRVNYHTGSGVVKSASRDQAVDQKASEHPAQPVLVNRGDGFGRGLVSRRGRLILRAGPALCFGQKQHGLGTRFAIFDAPRELHSSCELPRVSRQKGDPNHGAILPDQPVDFLGDLERIDQNRVGQLADRLALFQRGATLSTIVDGRYFPGLGPLARRGSIRRESVSIAFMYSLAMVALPDASLSATL